MGSEMNNSFATASQSLCQPLLSSSQTSEKVGMTASASQPGYQTFTTVSESEETTGKHTKQWSAESKTS
jgi:hypothetical protein